MFLVSGKIEVDLFDVLYFMFVVCGYSRKVALDTFRAVESFDRGFYLGLFGWISVDGVEFVVVICLVLVYFDGDEVFLYVGVGVVGFVNA